MSGTALREAIRTEARRLGFARVGFAPADDCAGYGALCAWLAVGHAGEMAYLGAQAALRRSPAELLPEARSVVAVLAVYGAAAPPPAPGTGRVARYARGADYHGVLRARLTPLVAALPRLAGRPVAARVAVDTAPILERATAAAAGLGFVGKNTQLITPGLGSYTVLAEVITDLELPPDAADGGTAFAAATRPRCGRCAACLTACPTAAFPAPYVLDARRCISYLTIELRGVVPRALRAAIGDRIFGCDVCQEVCPFNRRAPATGAADLAPVLAGGGRLPLAALLDLGAAGYRRLVGGTALRRLRRAQIQRNAAIALGNAADRGAVPLLARALGEAVPLVRGHAAWALGRLGGAAARDALAAARAAEADPEVRAEIEAALAEAG